MTTDDTENLEERIGALVARVEGLVTRSEALDAVDRLTALVVDAEATKNRLRELRRADREIARVRTELIAEASRHNDTVRADRRALDARTRELDEREHWLQRREAQVEAAMRPPDPNARRRHFPGGMVGEPDDEPPARAADPHFGRQSVTASDEEMVLEKAGPSTGTLTRSVPRPRRSMRRGAVAP